MRIRPNGEKHGRKAEVLPRSYVVQDDRGTLYKRNRRQIISVTPSKPFFNLQQVAKMPWRYLGHSLKAPALTKCNPPFENSWLCPCTGPTNDTTEQAPHVQHRS